MQSTSTNIRNVYDRFRMFEGMFGRRSEEVLEKKDGKKFKDFIDVLKKVAEKYGAEETNRTIIILDGEESDINIGYFEEEIIVQTYFVEDEWDWDPHEDEPSIITFRFDHTGKFKELELDYV